MLLGNLKERRLLLMLDALLKLPISSTDVPSSYDSSLAGDLMPNLKKCFKRFMTDKLLDHNLESQHSIDSM